MAHATTRIDAALAGVVAGNLNQLAAVWPDARRADAEALRRARVASRRLREAIALARHVAPRIVGKRAPRDLRRIGHALGRVREMAVARRDLEAAAIEHGWTSDQFIVVRARLERESAAAERHMRRRLASFDLEALESRLTALASLESAPADARAWRGPLAAAVVRRAGRVARARTRIGTLYEPQRLHALRIAVKKLRYAVELLGVLTGAPVTPLVATLKAQQQQYGRLHDRQVLLDEGRQAAAVVPRRDGRRMTPVIETLESECRRGHAEAVAALGTIDGAVSAARHVAAALTQPARRLALMPLEPQAQGLARVPRRRLG